MSIYECITSYLLDFNQDKYLVEKGYFQHIFIGKYGFRQISPLHRSLSIYDNLRYFIILILINNIFYSDVFFLSFDCVNVCIPITHNRGLAHQSSTERSIWAGESLSKEAELIFSSIEIIIVIFYLLSKQLYITKKAKD